MFAKLRPVGNKVYPPVHHPGAVPWPFGDAWLATFTPSGTAALALSLALASRRLPPPDQPEVILPAYGCPDLVAAVIVQGARPVLVDFAPAMPFMDLTRLEQAFTKSTIAVVAVDFLGLPERLAAISELTTRRGVYLVEDSAQRFPPAAMASETADAMVLSFGRGKPINLMGGGLLLAHESQAQLLAQVRQELPQFDSRYGAVQKLKRLAFNLLLNRWLYGWMERLPFLHLGETRFKPLAAYGLWSVPDGLLAGGLAGFQHRADWATCYDHELAFLDQAGWILLPRQLRDKESSPTLLLRYPMLAPDRASRDRALQALNAAGIGANALYGASLAETRGTAPHLGNVDPGDFPQACDFADRLITLPTHDGTRLKDIEVIKTVMCRFA